MEGLALVDIKTCYKVIIIKRAWFWHKSWDRIKNKKSDHMYTHLTFGKTDTAE